MYIFALSGLHVA